MVDKDMKWKDEDPKSVVITDFGISKSMKVSEYKLPWSSRMGIESAGWAPPEQWLSKTMGW